MNTVPLVYRLILMGMLPVIALVLYLNGQNYDPALIDFTPAVQQKAISSVASSKDVHDSQSQPAVQDMAGFRKFGGDHRYTKENLYEHVDGHAEYFISAGFQGLTVTEYISTGSKAAQPEVQAEVYDMGNSMQAFGVLADESGEKPLPVPVGTMGYKTSMGVNFIKGRYYVKISAFSAGTPVISFAQTFAQTLAAGRDSFEAFSKFPNLGKVENTRFVKEDYRGLDFLHNVIEREYSAGGGRIKVALMASGEHSAREQLSSFLDYFGKSGMRYDKIRAGSSEAYKVYDKYEGNWFLIRSKEAVFGVFGTEDEGILKFFIKDKG